MTAKEYEEYMQENAKMTEEFKSEFLKEKGREPNA